MQCGPFAVLLAAVEVELRAGSARADVGHPPPVLLVAGREVAPAGDPLLGQADLVAPDAVREVVGRVDGGRQALARHAHVAGQELPRPVDGLALEVVAEAPVAEHLEEGVVARRAPHLLEVVVLAGDPQAALEVDGPGVAALLGPGQGVLERDHAGVDEQQGLVAGRHERRGRHDLVAALGEELHEPPADLGGGQRGDPRVMAKLGARHRGYGSEPAGRGSGARRTRVDRQSGSARPTRRDRLCAAVSNTRPTATSVASGRAATWSIVPSHIVRHDPLPGHPAVHGAPADRATGVRALAVGIRVVADDDHRAAHLDQSTVWWCVSLGHAAPGGEVVRAIETRARQALHVVRRDPRWRGKSEQSSGDRMHRPREVRKRRNGPGPPIRRRLVSLQCRE